MSSGTRLASHFVPNGATRAPKPSQNDAQSEPKICLGALRAQKVQTSFRPNIYNTWGMLASPKDAQFLTRGEEFRPKMGLGRLLRARTDFALKLKLLVAKRCRKWCPERGGNWGEFHTEFEFKCKISLGSEGGGLNHSKTPTGLPR